MTSNQQDIVKMDLGYLLDEAKKIKAERDIGGKGDLDAFIEQAQIICERGLRILGN